MLLCVICSSRCGNHIAHSISLLARPPRPLLRCCVLFSAVAAVSRMGAPLSPLLLLIPRVLLWLRLHSR